MSWHQQNVSILIQHIYVIHSRSAVSPQLCTRLNRLWKKFVICHNGLTKHEASMTFYKCICFVHDPDDFTALKALILTGPWLEIYGVGIDSRFNPFTAEGALCRHNFYISLSTAGNRSRHCHDVHPHPNFDFLIEKYLLY